jgi:anthranilate/para-aminobenzoate synthase component I
MSTVFPPKEEFLCRIAKGELLPLAFEIAGQSITPLSALEALRPGGNPVLLESCRTHEAIGRYSFVASEPYLTFKSHGNDIELILPKTPQGKFGKHAATKRPPLVKLRELLQNFRTARVPGLPPFTGGAVGFFSYDFVRQLEDLPVRTSRSGDMPDAYIQFVDRVVAFDHILNKAWVIVIPGAREQELGFRKPGPDEWPRLYDEACERIEQTISLLRNAAVSDNETAHNASASAPELAPELTQDKFESMVRKCKEYIAAGDIYQANLSQPFSAAIAGRDPLRLYKILCSVNPSPFAAFLDFGDMQIVSSSPERLIRLTNDVADTRPIAGTRRRGVGVAETQQLASDLLANEKERAEHIMLLDLERNDLGRVCAFGSVSVDEFMVVEEYSHVIHIVSNVRGTLETGKDALDLLRAVFPGGTITGAPKVRCMEIIDELEPAGRGPYTGSLGYIANTGDMDMNIIIRTFVIRGDVARVQAGAGIVADSDPTREYHETLQKAEALRQAFRML